jgi:O-antigen ligase
MLVVFSGIVVFQAFTIRNSAVPVTQNQTGLRALNISDQNTTRGRLEIWRLATKAWLENPRTFLIGTGDLASAMKVKFDARSSGYGLSKDSLTHAHNLWVQTAGESGLLGLCAMLWLWGWVILKAWQSRDAGALALLAAIFVINSVDYLFFYAPVHLAFWMAAAGLKPPEPSPDGFEGSAIVKA